MKAQAIDNTEKHLLFTFALPNQADPGAFAQYGPASIDAATRAGVIPHFRGPVRHQVFGDTPVGFAGVAEFPTLAAIESFFSSNEDYLRLVPARDRAFTSLDVFATEPGPEGTSLPEDGCVLLSFATPDPTQREALAEYGQASKQLLRGADARNIGRYPVVKSVLGEHAPAFVSVVRFPNEASALEMFASDAYKSLAPIRDKAMPNANAYLINL